MLTFAQDVYNLLLRIDYLSVFNTMLWPQIYAIHWSLSPHLISLRGRDLYFSPRSFSRALALLSSFSL